MRIWVPVLLLAASATGGAADTFRLSLLDEPAAVSEASTVDSPQTWHLPGTYRATDKSGKRLVIDENLRIKRHSLAITNNATGEQARIQFPHRLKKDEDETLFRTTGQVRLNLWIGGLPRPCDFKVQFEGDSYQEGNALDVTLRFPASGMVDAYGRCYGMGQASAGFGYSKENEGKK